MKRRQFLTLLGGAAVWPWTAAAQNATRRIGVFVSVVLVDELAVAIAAFGLVVLTELEIDQRMTQGTATAGGRDQHHDESRQHDQVRRHDLAHEVAHTQAPCRRLDQVGRITPARGETAEIAGNQRRAQNPARRHLVGGAEPDDDRRHD